MTQEEQERVLKVIQRAEEISENEQRRVGYYSVALPIVLLLMCPLWKIGNWWIECATSKRTLSVETRPTNAVRKVFER